jgi:hypothetical protein
MLQHFDHVFARSTPDIEGSVVGTKLQTMQAPLLRLDDAGALRAASRYSTKFPATPDLSTSLKPDRRKETSDTVSGQPTFSCD